MQEIITINGEKYIKYIEQEKKEYKRWRAKDYKEGYFSLNFYGETIKYFDTKSDIDNYLYSEGRYFQTEQEAIKERDKRLAIVRVNDAILELNEGWEPDWNNVKEVKYHIMKVHYMNNNVIETCENRKYMFPSMIFYIKSEEISDKIIQEHQEDLKLIFDIGNL